MGEIHGQQVSRRVSSLANLRLAAHAVVVSSIKLYFDKYVAIDLDKFGPDYFAVQNGGTDPIASSC